jgi:hypothetical protein
MDFVTWQEGLNKTFLPFLAATRDTLNCREFNKLQEKRRLFYQTKPVYK